MNLKFPLHEIEAMLDEGGYGFCLLCEEQADYYCDPDTRGGRCNECDASTVYGLEELIQMGELIE